MAIKRNQFLEDRAKVEAWKAKQPAKPAGPKLLQHFQAAFNEKSGHNQRSRCN